MPYSFVLVHSPLVGPYSWSLVGNELTRLGHRVVIPSVLPALDRSSGFADSIADYVREAVAESVLRDPLVLVGHSAAGAYLPAIGSRLDRTVSAYLFVDARLPKSGASLADQDSPEEEQHRRLMAADGLLPPWSEWFRDGVVEELIPREKRRKRFVEELRRIPLALFHEEITFNAQWPDAPVGYLRFSGFYEPQAREAAIEGWHVNEIDAKHLHPITHPLQVTKLVLNALDRMDIV